MSRVIKPIAIIIAIILFLLGVYFLTYTIDRANIASVQEADVSILDVDFAIDKHGDYGIYTVQLADNSKYTFTSVLTEEVRGYYIGDMLPVIIDTYKDGTKNIYIDNSRLAM